MSEEITQELSDAAKLAQVTAQFEDFKQKVRAEAVRVQRSNGWCEDGLNDTLTRLGLPVPPRPKSYYFEVPTTGRLRYEIVAQSPEQAQAAFEQQLSRDTTSDRLRYGCKVGALSADLEKVERTGGHTPEELAAAIPVNADTDDEDDEDDDI